MNTGMERAVVTALITLAALALCDAAPTTSPGEDVFLDDVILKDIILPLDDRARAEAYLSKFYYNTGVTNFTNKQLRLDSFDAALENMQEFFGLEVTGKLDSNTLEVMAKPRCGVTDVLDYEHFGGRPRWRQKVVTYRITEYTSDLSRAVVDSTIARAFKLYSDIIPLDFRQINSGTADIMILFKARYHGDFYPFDGPSGVLAHANSPGPGEGGDTHFDEDEQWTQGQAGVNLLLVAAHEFGHALGLSHSRDRSALMYPTYSYVNTNGYKLPSDDRRGVQALYGVRSGRPDPKPEPRPPPHPKPEPRPPPRPKPEPRPPPRPKPEPRPPPHPKPEPRPPPHPKPEPRPNPPKKCDPNLIFDAATAIRNELYFFKNGYFWKKSGYFNGVMTKKVSSTWSGISQVDAAYEYKAKDIALLFKGRRYWGTRGITVLSGYPKSISNLGFPSYVKKIDAAVHVESTGRTLFFALNIYWSFNEQTGKMDPGYPRNIYQGFPGIGYRVDAAFENHGYLYFSNGAKQTEYHYPSRKVVRTLLNYAWLECN